MRLADPSEIQAEFIRTLAWSDIPAAVQERLSWLMADFAAASVAGREVPAAALAADHAAVAFRGQAATSLLDGRALSVPGAAWANGVLANALDLDDGHRLVKGHPGAVVIPAALAVAEDVGATREQLLTAVAVGYEIALRAGMDLHARDNAYHGSGAWGALGATAAAAHLLGSSTTQIGHALGLAEYHAPNALIMRSVDDPAMTKDGIGWGALTGVSAAQLAHAGFSATPSEFVAGCADDRDLGRRWLIEDVYVKPFPCCRWSQAAVRAALAVRHELTADGARAERIVVRTFAAAAALSRRPPTTTEDAQYSLVWPVAAALTHGRFDVEDVVGAGLNDEDVAACAERVEIVVDTNIDKEFPARRLSQVQVQSAAGPRITSGIVEPPGEPDDPDWSGIVERKLHRFVDRAVAGAAPAAESDPPATARLADVLAMLTGGVPSDAGAGRAATRVGDHGARPDRARVT
jgi:2-methylcitrate dehydratase PrpD